MDLVDRRQSAQVLRPDQLVLPLTRGGGKPDRTVQESLSSHCPRLLSKIFKSAWMTLGNSSMFGPIVDPGGAGDGRSAGPRHRRRTAHRPRPAGSAGLLGDPGWSVGLTIHGRPDWVDPPQPETGAEGLVAVVVARDAGRSRVSVCGYLVDVYCLG